MLTTSLCFAGSLYLEFLNTKSSLYFAGSLYLGFLYPQFSMCFAGSHVHVRGQVVDQRTSKCDSSPRHVELPVRAETLNIYLQKSSSLKRGRQRISRLNFGQKQKDDENETKGKGETAPACTVQATMCA